MRQRRWQRAAAGLCLMVSACALAQNPAKQAQQGSPKEIVEQMLAREKAASATRNSYQYTAIERSDRTGGHLWVEHVVETQFGRVRLLLTEDGQPLSADRAQQERDRLAGDAAHPEAFMKREKVEQNDENHARLLLEVLPRAFILENMRDQNGDLRIDFHPDPTYSPSGIEERVLHGMSGYLLVNQDQLRLHYVQGRLPQDISIGFGLVNVKAGSHFETLKAPFDGQWRTVKILSDVQGKAVMLKSISKNKDLERRDFHRVDNNLTVAQAVALVQK